MSLVASGTIPSNRIVSIAVTQTEQFYVVRPRLNTAAADLSFIKSFRVQPNQTPSQIQYTGTLLANINTAANLMAAGTVPASTAPAQSKVATYVVAAGQGPEPATITLEFSGTATDCNEFDLFGYSMVNAQTKFGRNFYAKAYNTVCLVGNLVQIPMRGVSYLGIPAAPAGEFQGGTVNFRNGHAAQVSDLLELFTMITAYDDNRSGVQQVVIDNQCSPGNPDGLIDSINLTFNTQQTLQLLSFEEYNRFMAARMRAA